MGEEQPVVLYGALGGERGTLITLAADGSGRLVARSVMVGVDVNGDERIVRSEADGTPRSQVILWDYAGAQQIRAAGEPATGEARSSLYSTDPSGDIVGLRSDEQRILRNRPYEPYRVQANVGLTGAWATAFTVPANSIAKVWVHLGQTSGGTTDITVALRVRNLTIGVGIPVYIDSPPPGFGPFILGAGDLVEVYRVTGANGACFVDYELYSTGDVNTGV